MGCCVGKLRQTCFLKFFSSSIHLLLTRNLQKLAFLSSILTPTNESYVIKWMYGGGHSGSQGGLSNWSFGKFSFPESEDSKSLNLR